MIFWHPNSNELRLTLMQTDSAFWIHGRAFSLGACGFRVWSALPYGHSLTVAKVLAGAGSRSGR